MNCQECRIGHYQPTRSTYHKQFNGQFITVPDAPAYVCDVCGYIYYDAHFTQRMESLMADFAAMDRPAATRKPQATAVPPAAGYVGPSRRSG